jgi:hypothetical protein
VTEETQETSPYDRLPDETDTAFLARAIMTLARVTEEQGESIATNLDYIDDTLRDTLGAIRANNGSDV